MNLLRYYIRDARDGIRRNAGASIAAVLLIFISLSITGSLFLLKSSVNDVLDFLNAQVKVKIIVQDGVNAADVAHVLQTKSFVKSATVETKAQALDRLKKLFTGKEYLFEAFADSGFPDAVVVELQDQNQVTYVAEEMRKMNGVADVMYAQDFAQSVVAWTKNINTYGLVTLGIFLLSSFLTVSLAISLAIYQRQKEIRIKLLLGAKESHVRGQFLLEGGILGVIGSILASFAVYVVYQYGLFQLHLNYGYIFKTNTALALWTLGGIILSGILIGLIGSYLSTRKRIRHA